MTTSENCQQCLEDVSQRWIAPITIGGRQLAGTGVWLSQREDGLCATCARNRALQSAEKRRRLTIHLRLVQIGGERPYREFRFDRYQTTQENLEAFNCARAFCPERDNLYFWGACGVGKSHLAFSIARAACEAGLTVEFLKPSQLLRQVRMREPEEEQRCLDRIARADVFVLDDLGIGNESLYARQIFQEILDARTSAYRAGLVVTSKYSLSSLAFKLNDDTLVSRLAGMARSVQIKGADWRVGPSYRSSGWKEHKADQ
jgi:DNA replication protein DnaC